MAETEYGRYFITETPPNPSHPQNRNRVSDVPWWNSLFINEELGRSLNGAFYLESSMILRTGTIELMKEPHTHSFDEYLLFHGTNPEDISDLGGEVELWLGGEKHMITRTCAVFAPAGVPHNPMFIHRVDRPFLFITVSNECGYAYEPGDGRPAQSAGGGK
jgi:hypothetical protein